jgi:hypothetical protein
MDGVSYRDLGFNSFGIRTITENKKQTQQEIRNSMQFGAVAASSVYIGSNNDVFKADKDGISLGNKVFEDAPFRVDMNGNATMTSASITTRSATISPDEDGPDVLLVNNTAGSQLFAVDSTNGWIEIGSPVPDNNHDPNILLYVTKESDSYIGINMQNKSAGEFASNDFIMFNNELNLDMQNYWELPEDGWLDMGVTSSNYADPAYAMMGPNNEYIWAADDFYVGCTGGDANLYFFMGPLDTKDSIKCSIDHHGVFFPVQATTANKPPYVKGGLYFDITLNKLRVGGATAWETITSV